ncbi:helix-turn-helix domain-containing protein [Corynebacterium pacaense]|uniref:helix-turn-helix domain-containing protein n=1 Tax=Corynebacterium pacaense TaxID=1816684 RepID=UPI0009BAC2D3|nr:helix-turn-helix transcriptional regulator [Corynebacterium pacaense]
MQKPPPDLEWETYGSALAHRARQLRRYRGLTQEQLSELSGVSRNLIQNIERGYASGKPNKPANPSLKTLYSLSYALDVPPAALMPDLGVEVQLRSPSSRTLPKLAEILEVDIAWSGGVEFELPE